jgi:hypothetical protein
MFPQPSENGPKVFRALEISCSVQSPQFLFSSRLPIPNRVYSKWRLRRSKERETRETERRDWEEKMFFHIVLERKIQLHPRYFGPHLREKLVSKLMKEVEGTCRFTLYPRYELTILHLSSLILYL